MSKSKDMTAEDWNAKKRDYYNSNPDYRKSQSEYLKAWRANKENLERESAKAKERYNSSDDVKRRRAEAKKKWASSPEGQAKRQEQWRRRNERLKLDREYAAFMSKLLAEASVN